VALTHAATITQQEVATLATYLNTTTYGGANQDRNEAAEFLLWSKTDEDGARTFDNPAQGDVLTKLSYEVDTDSDGWYEAIKFRIQFYSAGANYVERLEELGEITQHESIFYYETTGKIYKAITASTGQDPENTDYFEEIALTDLGDYVDNTNVEVFIEDFACEFRTNDCIRDRFVNVTNCSQEQRDANQQLLYMKQSADTNFANGNPELYEKIIRNLETTCAQCL
jgi:hypothetical protein